MLKTEAILLIVGAKASKGSMKNPSDETQTINYDSTKIFVLDDVAPSSSEASKSIGKTLAEYRLVNENGLTSADQLMRVGSYKFPFYAKCQIGIDFSKRSFVPVIYELEKIKDIDVSLPVAK